MNEVRIASIAGRVAENLKAGSGRVWHSEDAEKVIPDLKRALLKWVDQNKDAIEQIANLGGSAVLTIHNSEYGQIFDLTVEDRIRVK